MNIGIIGLGLIGGSLAIDLRKRGHILLGVSRKADTCQQAVARGVVDEASLDLALMSRADVIFLCTPLGAIDSTVEQLLPHLSDATLLTDVGSVKATVVQSIAPRWPNFIGGHPMAGTSENGLDAAFSGLFTDRPYVLTPIESTPPVAIETVSQLVQSLGCRLYQCDPTEHDRAVAWISHLPVMISSSLIAACSAEGDTTVLELAQKLASSGFCDTSRVGGGNPELGLMMARYNQPALLRSLQGYRQQLDQMIQAIEQGDWTTVEQRLTQTQQARPYFL
jgi:arogenate dehydrogenase (NADP+)